MTTKKNHATTMKTAARLALWCAAALVALLAALARADEPLDVNTATKEQLEALPGIGQKTASDIVRERDENGPFASVEDLARVPSMTPAMLAKLRGLVRAGASEQIVVTEGKVVSREVVKKVLMRFAGEPTIKEVQERAVDYARAHPDVTDGWRTRARWNAIMPRFTVEGQGTLDNGLREVENPTSGNSKVNDAQNTGRLTVQGQWDLDRLIYEPQESAIARESVRIAGLRDRVLDEVTRRYFERRRLQVELELSPPTDLTDRIKKELRLQELTADIDAVTGGWFSSQLERAGRE